MAPYPKELRIRVVVAVAQGERTIAEIARLFSVGQTFVKKMLRLHRAGADLAPRHGGGPKAVLQATDHALLRTAVIKQPDVTLAELQHLLASQGKGTVSVATICRVLHQLRLPRKKKPRGQ